MNLSLPRRLFSRFSKNDQMFISAFFNLMLEFSRKPYGIILAITSGVAASYVAPFMPEDIYFFFKVRVILIVTLVGYITILISITPIHYLFYKLKISQFGAALSTVILSAFISSLSVVPYHGDFAVSKNEMLVHSFVATVVFCLPPTLIVAHFFLARLNAILPDSETVRKSDQDVDQTELINHRLPPGKRGNVLSLQAHGKYVEVCTHLGRHEIRLPITQAVMEVHSNSGMQVHRSHWIAYNQIAEVYYMNGNPRILLIDGNSIPVSRAKVKILKENLQDISHPSVNQH